MHKQLNLAQRAHLTSKQLNLAQNDFVRLLFSNRYYFVLAHTVQTGLKMVQRRSIKIAGECRSSSKPCLSTWANGSTRSILASLGQQLPDVNQKRKLKVVNILEGFMFQVRCCEHLAITAGVKS